MRNANRMVLQSVDWRNLRHGGIDGPFNGFNAVIEEINEEKRKLQVMVKIFGRKTPLELNYMQVDKV